ncbi:MAG: PfkB family carbohydrate kinase [Bacillota bacterium]|nr:PfkB family carbohydrate kinase [Bacillota bacterium]
MNKEALWRIKVVGCMDPGKSLNLNRLGIETTLHTVFGADQPGEFIENYLKKENLNFIKDIDPAGTNTHINIMDKQGNRHPIHIIEPSFNPKIDLDRLEQVIKKQDYIALNVNNYCRKVIPIIKKHHKTIWCDLGDYEVDNAYFNDFFEVSTHVTMSGIKLKDQYNVLKNTIEKGKRLAVITNGSEGSIAQTDKGEFIETPIIKEYKMVDTNGAGDSFFAGLLYGAINGYSIKKSLQIATIVAGLTINSTELFNRKLSCELVENEYQKYFSKD